MLVTISGLIDTIYFTCLWKEWFPLMSKGSFATTNGVVSKPYLFVYNYQKLNHTSMRNVKGRLKALVLHIFYPLENSNTGTL